MWKLGPAPLQVEIVGNRLLDEGALWCFRVDEQAVGTVVHSISKANLRLKGTTSQRCQLRSYRRPDSKSGRVL